MVVYLVGSTESYHAEESRTGVWEENETGWMMCKSVGGGVEVSRNKRDQGGASSVGDVPSLWRLGCVDFSLNPRSLDVERSQGIETLS